MVKWKLLWVFALLLLAMTVHQTAGLYIGSIWPRRGSIAGGTRVSVYGSGFSTDAYTTSNLVFFGNIPCEVDWYTATSSRLECITTPYTYATEGGSSPSLQAQIINNGQHYATTNGASRFVYDWNYTPQVRAITPNSGPLGSIIEIGGYRFSGNLDSYERFYVGGYICDPRNPANNQRYGSYWRWPLLFIRCRITEQEVGGWNATAIVTGQRGTTWNHSESLYPMHNWSLAMYELYPDIHEVSPQSGSSEGGTLLTIRGTGFGMNSEDITVDVDGTPCEVVAHSPSEIWCWTGRPPRDSPAIADEELAYPAVDEGYRFRGSRGVRFFQYRGISGHALSHLYSDSDYPDNPDRYGIYPSFSTKDDSNGNNYGERFLAFFNPHASGQHTFFLASDDEGGLWMAQSSNISETDKIASGPYGTGWNNFYQYEEQRSVTFDLQVGEDYLLVGEFKEGGGRDYLQIGVLMHETSLTFSETQQVNREKQQVELATDGHYDIQSLRAAVNRSEVEEGREPEFVVEWGGRESGVLSLLDLEEDTDLLKNTILGLFEGVCSYGLELGVFHYDDGVFGFEGGVGSTETWEAWNGQAPEIVEDESFCGRHSLYVEESRALAFNLDPEDYDGFRTSDYPFLCLGYKLLPGHPMALRINIRDHGWRTIAMTTTQQFSDLVGNFEDFSSADNIMDDDSWHYACTDLQQLLQQGLAPVVEEEGERENGESGVHRILGFGFYSDPDPEKRGFYVDEVSFSSEERIFDWESYLSPARPNGIAVHDITATTESHWSDGTDGFNLTVAMEIIPTSCDYDLPLINITLLNESAPGLLEFDFSRDQMASVPLGGSYTLSLHTHTTSPLTHDASDEEIKTALEELPDVGEVTVAYLNDPLPQDTLGKFCPGRRFTVQFETLPGDQPLLEVDTSNLTGDGLQVSVREELTGGLFLRPIPGHLLQTAETTPQVHVRVRGQLAACSGGSEQFEELDFNDYKDTCSFIYAPTLSPTVLSVSPVQATAGDSIQIQGMGFSPVTEENYVLFSDIRCNITSSNETQIECTLAMGSAGSKSLYLHVLTAGVANTTGIVLNYTITANSIAPPDGSTAGGTKIIITGTGFVSQSDSDDSNPTTPLGLPFPNSGTSPSPSTCSEWQNRVEIGPNDCEIIDSTHTTITCFTPAPPAAGTYDVMIVVECTDGSAMFTHVIAGWFTYNHGYTPTTTDVTPTESSVVEGESITITGTGFSNVLEENHVQLGDADCILTSATETTLTCNTPPHPPGSVAVTVRVEGKGKTSGSFSFEFITQVDSISHCSGSVFGGQGLRLAGVGFPSDSSLVEVRVGVGECALEEVTGTTITCVTPTSAQTHTVTNIAYHPEYGLGYKWVPEHITIHVGDTVEWSWTGSAFTTRRSVVQVDAPGDTEYNGQGFQSTESVTGSFSHSFTSSGTYYYIAAGFGHIGFNGSVTVLDMETKNVPISVTINGIELDLIQNDITCNDTSTLYSQYSYSPAHTPLIEVLTRATVSHSDPIQIQVQGVADIADYNMLTVGGRVCTAASQQVVSLTRTEPNYFPSSSLTFQDYEFSCSVPALEPGDYRIMLHVGGRGWGYGSLEQTMVQVVPAVENTYTLVSGSVRGGLELSLPMQGLVATDITRTRVDIGSTPCLVQQIDSNGTLRCVVRPAVNDGYSSVIGYSDAVAYWSLQSDFFNVDGSYIESDGVDSFRSGGALARDADAVIFGEVLGQQAGISGNVLTDQSALFSASFIQTPILDEFTDPAGFGVDLWLKVTESHENYQIIVDSSSYTDGIARGYILLLNPCDELEFWVGVGEEVSLLDGCAVIFNQSQCSNSCTGYVTVDDEMTNLPQGVWHVIRNGHSDWSDWHHIAFGWEADNYSTLHEDWDTSDCTPQNGSQVLYVDSTLTDTAATSYLRSSNTPIQFGGTSRLATNVLSFPSAFDSLGPFTGFLDELAFYPRPLSAEEISNRVFYGSTENQPIWITVDGRDGIRTGVVPNVEISEWELEFENEMVVDWDSVREGEYVLDGDTAIRFEWTGLHGVWQVSQSVYASCDLEAGYVRQWAPCRVGGATTVWLGSGETYYFIDPVVDNCLQGTKIKVQVGEVQVIEWRIRQYDDITVAMGTGLLFQWAGPVPHNVIEMSSPLSDCLFVSSTAKQLGMVEKVWHETPTTSGEVAVSGLTAGEHHFVCSVPGHCQAGMSFTVTVVDSGGGGEEEESEGPVEHLVPWRIQTYDPITVTEGEILTFTWEGFHSLHQVTEEVYSSCDLSTEPLHIWGDPSVDNRASIAHLIPGTYYFICSISGHCDAGMRIEVTVLPNDGLPVIPNPVEAKCNTPSGRCSFAYAQDATPQLIAVEPDHSHAGTTLSVHGLGLVPTNTTEGSQTNDITIWIDKAPCEDVTVANSSAMRNTLECTVRDYESGFYHVDVFVTGKGFASVDTTQLVPGPIRNATISANSDSPYPIFFLAATVSSIVPNSGSVAGGTHVQISGTGFSQISERLSVSLGNSPCEITSSTLSEIQCITGASSALTDMPVEVSIRVHGFPASTSLQYTYDSMVTPDITDVNSLSGSSYLIGGDQIEIVGDNFANDTALIQVQIAPMGEDFDFNSLDSDNVCTVDDASETSITCTVPTKTAGDYNVIVHIQGSGLAQGDAVVTYALQIDNFSPPSTGSGGGIVLSIRGHGFPSISSDSDSNTQEISIMICEAECAVTESSVTELNCLVGPNNANSPFSETYSCNVTVSYGDDTTLSSDVFQFMGAITPNVVEIAPTVGGTAGGTTVTLTGSGLLPEGVSDPNSLMENDITVTIDGAVCEWFNRTTLPSDSSIECRTSEHSTTLEAEVRVFVRGKGYALSSEGVVVFEYVDLWSSVYTWGGGPLPQEGESVYIKTGQTVYLDTSPPPLNLILIEGALIFQDEQDLHLQAKYIFINNGKLQVGTEDQPFEHEAKITLHGSITDPEIPIYGAKVLGIRQGELDLHGKPRNITWVRLAETATFNDTTLNLQEPVDWVTGDRIVIAPTGKDGNETEENLIASVSPDGLSIELLNPVKFTHHGITEVFEDGQFIDIRAEVGLLSHNVIVEGTRIENPTGFEGLGSDQYGSQIFVHRMGAHPTPIRIEHTEVRYGGQAFRLGRYAIHFHLSGSMEGSYVRHCSIHHSFNRAITAHGVHNLLIEGNVAYDIMGHTYFVEDGIETNNYYLGNLGVLTRGSSSLLNTDQIPATFWITNPQNTFIGNAAAASRAYGFWYDLDNNPSGASRTGSVCPNKAPFGEFRDNVAHTCNEFGLRIWEAYQPFVDGCGQTERAIATLYNLTTYANGIHGLELSVVGHVRIVGFKIADNVENGIEIQETIGEWGGPKIENALIIAHTSVNTGEPQTGGIKTPNTPKLTVSNVTFVNFDLPSTSCLRACSQCKVFQGGFQVWFEGLSFLGGSEEHKTFFQWKHEVLYRDLDGTLTGLEGGWVTPDSDLHPPQLCTKSVPEFSLNPSFPGSVCSSDVYFLRMAWNQAQPLATLRDKGVNVTNTFGSSLIPWRHYRLTHLDGYMLTMPSGYEHRFVWVLPEDQEVDTTSYSAGVYGVREEDRAWVTHEFVMLPDHVNVGGNFEPTEHGEIPLTTDPHLSWHMDNETYEVTYLVSGVNQTSSYFDLLFGYRYEPCPRTGCPPPGIDPGDLEAIQRRWSNPASWPDNELPQEGDDVTISSRWRMLLDVTPPILSNVYVLGELMFEDERDYNFTANLILVQGPNSHLIIGTEDTPFQHDVTITLNGQRNDILLALGTNIVGSKAIGVFGNVTIHGKPKSKTWTRLAVSASTGDDQITLEGNDYPNWEAGEEIVIAPSGWDPEEAEIRTILSYDQNSGVITLSEPLEFDHVVYNFLEESDLQMGEPEEAIDAEYWWGDGGHLAPEVGLLTHNIVIQGGEDPDEPLELHHYGCRLLVGEYNNRGSILSGHLNIDSVEFRYCGQGGYFSPRDPRYSIAFRNNFDSSEGSYIRRCSIHHGYNTAIGIHTSNGVEISENVIWRTTDSGMKVGGNRNQILDNLAMMTTTVQPNTPRDNHAVDFPATFDVDRGNTVRGNAAAGSTRLGFRFSGEPCLEDNQAPTHEQATFWDNTAHSGLIGLNVLGLAADCTAIGGFTAIHQWNYAIFTSMASSLVATHLKIATGKVGLNLNVFGPNPVAHLLGRKSVTITDSLIVGSLPGESCEMRAPDFRVRGGVSFSAGDHKLGIMMSSFNQRRSKMDGTGAWHLMKGYPVIDGVMHARNLAFARFFNLGCNYGIYAIGNNPLSPDAVHPIQMTGTSKFNVEKNSLAFFYEPDVEWIVQEDCVDMDCDGPKHALVRDTDGRFVGSYPAQGSIVPFAELRFSNYSDRIPPTWLAFAGQPDVVEHRGVARGEPDNLESQYGGCVWVAAWQAYCCRNLQHHMFVIESMDEDSETRRISPLALTGGDTGAGHYTDLLNGPMDHGWCTYYTCLKRLSTFFSVVAVGTDYCIWMTGSAPNGLRFHLLNAEQGDAIKLCVWFKNTQRKDVYRNGIFIEPRNVEIDDTGVIRQLDGNFIPQRNEHSGANYFNRQSQIMHLIISGSDPIEIRTAPVVQVSLNLAVSIDDFFNVNELIFNLAFVLRIPLDSIRVVNIISEGSQITGQGRRSLLAVPAYNTTTITLQFGDPPAMNISTPEPPSVAEEIVMAGETNDSVDLDSNELPETPPENSNPLNVDPPESTEDFAEGFNSSVVDYVESVEVYEEVVMAVEEANSLGEQVVNVILTGEVEVENATVTGFSVIPASLPPPPDPPVIPPTYENSSAEVTPVEEIVPTEPPVVVEPSGEEEEIQYVIPVEMRVTMEPQEETGHLVHVAVTIFDNRGDPVVNLGLVNPWQCEASLLHNYGNNQHAPMLDGNTSVPFVRGVAEFTRLRVDRPAEQLTLVFHTNPTRFETRTSVHFTVVSPPEATPRERVGFTLEGSVGGPGLDQETLVEAVRLGLSELLNVDISRLQNVSVTTYTGGLNVEVDILDRQPTDPPDVLPLNTTLSILRGLVDSQRLVIYIDEQPFIAVPSSFEIVTMATPTTGPAPLPEEEHTAIILAVSLSVGAVMLSVVVMVIIHFCVRYCGGKMAAKKKKEEDSVSEGSDIPLHPVIHVKPGESEWGESGSELELKRTTPFHSSSSRVGRTSITTPPHVPSSAYEWFDSGAEDTEETSIDTSADMFSNSYADCWDTPPPPSPPSTQNPTHPLSYLQPQYHHPIPHPSHLQGHQPTSLAVLANPRYGSGVPQNWGPRPQVTTMFVLPSEGQRRTQGTGDNWAARR